MKYQITIKSHSITSFSPIINAIKPSTAPTNITIAKSPIPPIGAQRAAAQCRSPGRLSSGGISPVKMPGFLWEKHQ